MPLVYPALFCKAQARLEPEWKIPQEQTRKRKTPDGTLSSHGRGERIQNTFQFDESVK